MASSDSDAAYEVVRKNKVDQVLKQRRRKGMLEYLVRWKGYGKDEDSWEPESNLSNSALKIKEFLAGQISAKKSQARSSRSRSRSRSAGRTTAEKSPSRSQSHGRASRSTSRGRGSEKRAEKVKKVVEKVVDKTPEAPSRQSRRIETLKLNKSLETSATPEKFTVIKERKDVVDGGLRSRVTRTEVTTVTSSSSSSNAKAEAAPRQSDRLAQLKFRAASIWAAADTAVLVVFACVTLIVLSFIVEKYFHWIPVAVGNGFTAGAKWVNGGLGAVESNLRALGAYCAGLVARAWARIFG